MKYSVETIDPNNIHSEQFFDSKKDAELFAHQLADNYGNMRLVTPFCETTVLRYQQDGSFSNRCYISVLPEEW